MAWTRERTGMTRRTHGRTGSWLRLGLMALLVALGVGPERGLAARGTMQSAPSLQSWFTSSNVRLTTGTFGGRVTSDGGAAVTERGVVYSTSNNWPTIGAGGVTTVAATGGGTGNFTVDVTGLTAATRYYVRMYASNAAGSNYSDVAQVWTYQAGISSWADLDANRQTPSVSYVLLNDLGPASPGYDTYAGPRSFRRT